jgi:arylsulfatase A-like enzyme
MPIDRRGFLTSMATGVPAARSQSRRERPPNILLIITDDQGYGDLSLHGNLHLKTPHLDRIATEGAQLTQFQVCPVCSPTRASLMTGRYNYRTGVVDTYLGRSMMHSDEVTLAEMLRPAGYRTGIFGKWHLGDNYPLRAMDQGFDESLTHKGGGMGQPSDPPGSSYTDPLLFHNGKLGRHTGYCTDVFADAAGRFITANRSRAWFAYVATNAPHTPLEIGEEWVAPFRKSGLDDTTAKIYGMVSNLDAAVGRLLDTLRATGQERDTIVIFMTDNGPQQRRYNAGMRGLKASVYQGGIRVPCFMRWPARIKPGTSIDRITAHIDLLPTLLEAAGTKPPSGARLDGTSLLPVLLGKTTQWPDRMLFTQWHRGDAPEPFRNSAVRSQRWKLVDGKELYDVAADPGEQRDLAAAEPQRVREMRAAYERWFADVSSRGYDPPRIHVGSPRENPVILSRQDWRGPRAGWTRESLGHWEIDVKQAGRYQVLLTASASPDTRQVRISCGDAVVEATLAAGAKECRTELKLKSGPARLEASIETDKAPVGPDFLELRRS